MLLQYMGMHLIVQLRWVLMACRESGQYLFNFHAWHKNLLPAAHGESS